MGSDNVKNQIFERQNEPKFIRMLAAQRYLYSAGKRMNNWFLAISLFGPITLLYVFSFFSEEVRTWACVISGAIFFISFWINFSFVRKKKLHAAYIQEKFDTTLFDLPEGRYKKTHGVTEELINCTAVKLEEQSSLKNWYYDHSDNERPIEIIKCQEENLWWDGKQRTRYSSFLVALLIFSVLLTFGLLRLWDFNLEWYHFLPFSGLFFFVATTFISNVHVAKKLKNKYFDIRCKLQFIEEGKTEEWQGLHREIQDFIYEHRRKGALIPDWFYDWFKKGITFKVYQFDSGRGEVRIETSEWRLFPRHKLQKAAKDFDQAFESVEELSNSMVKKLEAASAQEITLEMGVKVSGDIGAYIAKASGEGQMKVTVKWTKETNISN